MKVKSLLGLCLLATSLVACGDDKKTPTTPTPPGGGTNTPVTLTAPGPDFPSEDQQLQDLRPTLRILNATSTPTGTRTYEFQISDTSDFSASSASSFAGPFKVVKTQANVAEGGSGKTEFPVPDDLQPTTRFYWRARARQGTTDGPWSATASFRTKVMGYNRPGELYDPLTAGETVGNPIGSVTFIPGRGAQNNDFTSMIQYRLVETMTSGEFSVEVEGIGDGGPGEKTKILTMYDGSSEIHDNRYRMTVEKRGDGNVAWRFIAGAQGNNQIDTEGAERRSVGLHSGQTYLWKATWGGGFRLQIFQGGVGGNLLYDMGKNVGGTYAPNPHLAQLGSPVPRSGPSSASVPGAIYRNAFIGQNRPRPNSLGTATLPKRAIQ